MNQDPTNQCVLLKDHNAVTPVRLEPAALQSQVKHSTTEPLCSRETGLSPPVKYFYWPFQGGASFVNF